ncbi:hypothetical protein EMIHUDRAFT_255549, partial [Emiliania huxleyi CCMP1516]|uniref:Uncharacterized protein n=2 Tax=Emiliania huxleyi TaxID=2903 RepID=A0A0D3J9F6_EMIH1
RAAAPLGKPCGDAYATADAAEPPQKPLLQKATPGELLGNGGSSQSPDEASPAVLEAKSAKSRSAPGALRCSSCHIEALDWAPGARYFAGSSCKMARSYLLIKRIRGFTYAEIQNEALTPASKKNFTRKLPRTTLGTGQARTGTNTGYFSRVGSAERCTETIFTDHNNKLWYC